ncbi:hypothetical protein A6A10_03980 [Otariodibacter oris]|nr:hypothetical protein A6A10_03980 [Otariodibacter oris]
MRITALLRGVTLIGKNKIPKMSYLIEILEDVGFKKVKTYIQSGNIILDTNLPLAETAQLIHKTIYEKIDADLSVIIKDKYHFLNGITDNPFSETYDRSRINLVFTNDIIDSNALALLKSKQFKDEQCIVTPECIYLYLPQDGKKKRLNTNYLEKHLSITATARRIKVIEKLIDVSESI